MNRGAGQYRHLVTIETATVAPNAYGDAVPTWSTFAQRWAAIVPTSGKEKERLQTRQAETMVTLHFRRVAGLVPKMRILWNGKTFEIIEIIDDPTYMVDQIVKAAEAV